MLCACVFVCVSIHSQLWAKASSAAHTPPTPVSFSHLSAPLPLPFRHVQSWSSYPHYRRLGPKMSPMRLLVMLAQLHPTLSCVCEAWKPGLNLLKASLTKWLSLNQASAAHSASGRQNIWFSRLASLSLDNKVTPELLMLLLIPKQFYVHNTFGHKFHKGTNNRLLYFWGRKQLSFFTFIQYVLPTL